MDAGNLVLGAFLVYAYFLFFDVRFVSKVGRGRPPVDGFIAPWTDQSLFQLLKTARPEDVGLERSRVASLAKMVLVFLPALYAWLFGRTDWIFNVLGFIGLTLLFGPVAFRASSQLKGSYDPVGIGQR